MRAAQSSERAIQARASWPAGSLAAMLSDEARSALFQLGVRRVAANGDVLIREQDGSAHVILLCQAVVKVTASLENGRAALLGIMVSGDVVGEMAALSDSPRCATVTAFGHAIVRIIPRNEFLDYLKKFPDAHFALTRMIMYRLREGNQRRVDFTAYPALTRLARVLEELTGSYGRRTRDLGALVGVEEDTTRKELGKLKDRGVIKIGYRSITIVDQVLLDKIAYEHE